MYPRNPPSRVWGSRSLAAAFVWIGLAAWISLWADHAFAELAVYQNVEALKKQLASATDPDTKVKLTVALSESLTIAGKGEDARALLDGLLRQKSDARLVIAKARSYLAYPPVDTDAATKLLRAYLKTDPKNIEGLLAWAHALRESGDYPNSLKTYEIVLKQNPKELEAFYGKINTLLVQKAYKEAAKVAQAALALDSKNPKSHYFMGRVFDARDDEPFGSNRAASEYREAVALSGNSSLYLPAVFFSEIVYSIGDPEFTLRDLKTRSPADPAVAFAEGLLLDRRGKLPEALAKFEGAVALDWNQPWCHFALGVLYSGTSITSLVTRQSGLKIIGLSQSDWGRAMSEFATVRFQDPSFPFTAMMDTFSNTVNSREDPRPLTPEETVNAKAWKNYLLGIRKHH